MTSMWTPERAVRMRVMVLGAWVGLIVGMLGTSKLIDEFPRPPRGRPAQDDPQHPPS